MNSQRSRDINELKKQALNFYTINSDIPKRIEDALNSLFYDSPYDAYGYLTEYFSKFIKPLFITKIIANKSIYYDSKCQPTFRLDIYCQDKNSEIKLMSIDSPCYSVDLVTDSVKIQVIQEDDAFRSGKLNEVVSFINTEINELIKNHNPLNQDEIDDKLRKLFKAKQTQCYEKFMGANKERSASQFGQSDGKKSKTPTSPKQKGAKTTARKSSQANTSNGLLFGDDINVILNSNFSASFVEPLISKAICKCSSLISKHQPFEIISRIRNINIDKYSMPIPLITILQNGKGYNGKQYLIKEFILYPKPHLTVHEGVELISKVNRYLRDTLYQSKVQPGAVNKCVTDNGALTCTLDTPQQGFELIENAIISILGNENAQNISLAVNIAASELFDAEKNKYEIGLAILKSTDELIEVYADLISKFPRLNMIIDPFMPNDQIAWYKLYMRISKFCLIANNIKLTTAVDTNIEEFISPRAEDEKPSDANKSLLLFKQPITILMPVNFYKYENATNVTAFSNKLKETENKKLFNGINCSVNETDDSFISDLAVGNQAKFLRIGGFHRTERVNKINRLIEIENYLAQNKQLLDPKSEQRDLTFPTDLEIPSEVFEAVQNEEAKSQKKK